MNAAQVAQLTQLARGIRRSGPTVTTETLCGHGLGVSLDDLSGSTNPRAASVEVFNRKDDVDAAKDGVRPFVTGGTCAGGGALRLFFKLPGVAVAGIRAPPKPLRLAALLGATGAGRASTTRGETRPGRVLSRGVTRALDPGRANALPGRAALARKYCNAVAGSLLSAMNVSLSKRVGSSDSSGSSDTLSLRLSCWSGESSCGADATCWAVRRIGDSICRRCRYPCSVSASLPRSQLGACSALSVHAGTGARKDTWFL